ncbi:F-box only protein 40 [Latimeria chalumnae]|uniref:F-box only protein 40 n=1 Tax=Latimeria chalumnae TaxID=7897 RepID=UPI0003C162F2|nr:PREDICTED: F-box only protein 40 [Latimeria chalumnae]XP_006007807.1 PREDICTED: F-box only protein 40 [Latimeria chalumnae]XP_006007808.1 PREDICTED: F-box only protein 40 [Latimeria chalumnae]|eukprot:XP_006007806.1 PREDICTED: F-box only protein 40 [Latimeria chalumnae]
MVRARKSPPGQHRHCEKCLNRHCRMPIEPTVSCVMINCHSHCGAIFHLCKEEEHRLLCPLERVPCLNSGYGCPFDMPRFKLARHLTTCPASVVCCSMDWNRWPITESDAVLYENVIKQPGSEDSLELSLALRDQKILFESLKLEELFPELIDQSEDNEITGGEVEAEGAVGGFAILPEEGRRISEADNGEMLVGLTQFEREALAKDKDVVDLSRYQVWEGIFSKELSSCLQTAENVEKGSKEATSSRKGGQEVPVGKDKIEEEPPVEEPPNQKAVEKTGFAPWQEGVLERLRKDEDVMGYNMYLVHHGSMLIRFGQMAACTPKEKDFVYGNLEAQELKTVCTYKVPISYSAKRTCKTGSFSSMKKKEVKAVDTSDLGVTMEDIPKWDVVRTTLLCALERELKGHIVSEAKFIDGLCVDYGTQTYSFELAPFKPNAVLADLMADGEPCLHLLLQSECVTRRHNKRNSAFTFTCQHFFRRDEYSSHFKNIHAEIQSGLSGWFEQRCPLSYLGCTYIQSRFRPSGQKAKVIYSQHLNTFSIKPQISPLLYQGIEPNIVKRKRGKSMDSLSRLPFEILRHIASFLDSFSLSQLAQVSELMRNVCSTLLQERGMVSLLWEKKKYSHGGTSWRARKKIWQFSNLFSTVDRWEFEDVPPMSEHLKTCPFYISEYRKDPVPLTSMCGPRERARENLLSMIRRRK